MKTKLDELKGKKAVEREEKEVESIIKKTRHRRTKAQLQNKQLSDSGFEVIATFFQMLSDLDAKRFNIPKQPKEYFIPLSKSYAQIANYFMPQGKPIYFVIASASLQTVMMIQNRNALVKEATKHLKKETPGKGQINSSMYKVSDEQLKEKQERDNQRKYKQVHV